MTKSYTKTVDLGKNSGISGLLIIDAIVNLDEFCRISRCMLINCKIMTHYTKKAYLIECDLSRCDLRNYKGLVQYSRLDSCLVPSPETLGESNLFIEA